MSESVQPDTLRTFIAVEPDARIRQWHQGVRDQLSASHRGVRWVRPESFHLTLSFLGDVERERVPVVSSCMAETLRDEPAFSVRLGQPGVFGRSRAPRVFWIALESGETLNRLKELQSRLVKNLDASGFPTEKRSWKPHLTLGRNPRSKSAPDWEKVADPSEENLELNVDHWTLFSSELSSEGPRYEVLARSELAAASPGEPACE